MWHTILHALNTSSYDSLSASVDGHEVVAIDLPSTAFQQPLGVTFDATLEFLAALPRLYIEPDGSFIWLSDDGADEWKIDGQLNDSPGGLMTVELKITGRRPWPGLESVLHSVDWPRQAIAFEMVRQGIYLDVSVIKNCLGDQRKA